MQFELDPTGSNAREVVENLEWRRSGLLWRAKALREGDFGTFGRLKTFLTPELAEENVERLHTISGNESLAREVAQEIKRIKCLYAHLFRTKISIVLEIGGVPAKKLL